MPSPLGEANASSTEPLTWKLNITINRPAPFPFGKRRAEPVEAGGGIGPTAPPNKHGEEKASGCESDNLFEACKNSLWVIVPEVAVSSRDLIAVVRV